MGKKLSAYNLHMKRELKGKMKGKTKAQRKSIFKAAARAWKSKKKGNPKPRSKPKSGGSRRSSSTTRRSNTTMGKKGGFNMSKIFGLVRKGALAAPAVVIAMGTATPQEKFRIGIKAYTGFDIANGRFNFADLGRGWGPYVGAVVTTYGIPKLTSIIRGL